MWHPPPRHLPAARCAAAPPDHDVFKLAAEAHHGQHLGPGHVLLQRLVEHKDGLVPERRMKRGETAGKGGGTVIELLLRLQVCKEADVMLLEQKL
jgi:hypothetical protein